MIALGTSTRFPALFAMRNLLATLLAICGYAHALDIRGIEPGKTKAAQATSLALKAKDTKNGLKSPRAASRTDMDAEGVPVGRGLERTQRLIRAN
jgi:hypothetical protein